MDTIPSQLGLLSLTYLDLSMFRFFLNIELAKDTYKKREKMYWYNTFPTWEINRFGISKYRAVYLTGSIPTEVGRLTKLTPRLLQ